MRLPHSRGRRAWKWGVVLLVAGVVCAACGGDDGGGSDGSGSSVGSSEEVCALLSDSEVQTLLGQALTPEPAGSDSPYPACSWNTGRLIVQVAEGDSIVLAPDQECPSVDIGDEGVDCPGSVQFVVGGSRVIVQTIEDVTDAQLVAVAEALAPKLG